MAHGYSQTGDASTGALPERRSGTRRRHTVQSLLYGGVRPRRRVGRRVGDHQHVFLDWHDSPVLYLAIAIVLLSSIDAFLTLNLLRLGGEELNGIMRTLLNHDAKWFLNVKIGLTSLSVIVLSVVAQRRLLGWLRVERLLQAFCAGYLGLIAYECYLLERAVGSSGIPHYLSMGLSGG